MLILKLFLCFFRIGLFAIGGAYSFLPLLEKEVVERYHWLTKDEFLDVLAMVKIFPGAISIKFATYTGYKIAGFFGACVANAGNLLAPSIIVMGLSVFYTRYKNSGGVKEAFDTIRLAIFAMIIAVAFQIANPNQLMQIKSLFIILVSFVLFTYTKINPALIIIGAGIVGACLR